MELWCFGLRVVRLSRAAAQAFVVRPSGGSLYSAGSLGVENRFRRRYTRRWSPVRVAEFVQQERGSLGAAKEFHESLQTSA
jgi:hypothetical protein